MRVCGADTLRVRASESPPFEASGRSRNFRVVASRASALVNRKNGSTRPLNSCRSYVVGLTEWAARTRSPDACSRSVLCYSDPMDHSAKFFVGQIVHHKKFDYRGVVFDVDATFQGSDEWYELVARSRPPKDRPWYHVLVDGAEHTTYVAERHLIESEKNNAPISHPLVAELCGEFHEGRYSLGSWLQ